MGDNERDNGGDNKDKLGHMCNSAHAHSFDYKLLRSLLPGVSGNEYWITHIASLRSAIRPKRYMGASPI